MKAGRREEEVVERRGVGKRIGERRNEEGREREKKKGWKGEE